MAKIIQSTLDVIIWFVEEKKKHIKISENAIFCLHTMFFQVQTRILCNWWLTRYHGRFSFQNVCPRRINTCLSMSVKFSTVKCLSKYCFQRASQLLRTNYNHNCDQITFTMELSKNYHNSDGSRSHPIVLSFCSF